MLLLPRPPVKGTSFSAHTCSLKDTHCPSWPHTVPFRSRALSQTIKALTLGEGLPKPPRQGCSHRAQEVPPRDRQQSIGGACRWDTRKMGWGQRTQRNTGQGDRARDRWGRAAGKTRSTSAWRGNKVIHSQFSKRGTGRCHAMSSPFSWLAYPVCRLTCPWCCIQKRSQLSATTAQAERGMDCWNC